MKSNGVIKGTEAHEPQVHNNEQRFFQSTRIVIYPC